ncbi:asparagine synthase (glutamine-hydrolyzing) [Paradesulfitobacterium aromaticivorans]
MCGIIGWVDWNRDLRNGQNVIRAMTERLSARGPDAEEYWLAERAAFGHRRLIVIDAEGGRQPMRGAAGEHSCTLIYNGEIYNTEELRQELLLKGYTFSGHSDTEVLLKSYLAWGAECVQRLNGIFSFAVWDDQRERLFLARDRLGVKPLFYTERPGFILFASELKALLAHPEIEPIVDKDGLSEILLVGPARTPGNGIYKGIRELKGGQALLYSRQGMRIYSYWQLQAHAHLDDPATTVGNVRELFLDAVKRQLVSDVPIGTLLSGGLDSSAITAVASDLFSPLPTFSVDYVDNEKYFQPNDFQPNPDEPWIERVSRHFGTEHRSVVLRTEDLASSLADSMRARDLPGMADIDSSLLLFAKEIKKDITVGLSGECADEVFGGYPWFHREEALQAATFPWALRLEHRLAVLAPTLIQELNGQEYLRHRYQEALAEVPQESEQKNLIAPGKPSMEKRLREISYLTLTRFMPTLLDRKDRMTMASGLEVRVPFCDHRLVEYVWNIPWELKNYQGREKGLLRQALTGILPEDVLWRRKSPYPKTHNPLYLEKVGLWLSEILADSNSPLRPLLNVPTLKELIKTSSSMPSGRPWFGQLMDLPQLFAYLIQTDLWLREYRVSLSL